MMFLILFLDIVETRAWYQKATFFSNISKNAKLYSLSTPRNEILMGAIKCMMHKFSKVKSSLFYIIIDFKNLIVLIKSRNLYENGSLF